MDSKNVITNFTSNLTIERQSKPYLSQSNAMNIEPDVTEGYSSQTKKIALYGNDEYDCLDRLNLNKSVEVLTFKDKL